MEIKGKNYATWLVVLAVLLVVALVAMLCIVAICAIPFAALILVINMATHKGHIQFSKPKVRTPRPERSERVKAY
ncbi:hypothetical protein CJD36_003680 [Flavipsychrobacter stenotrophus]|uniref:Uncharacterized protein n=1 Tax=Flavipsychrobacter stenotrophus TaxID=2077091 RepID=A0A2S7T236_9BACT|nr:hypothetical protein CJD36_003680 [Flavipsychrobacter stenotrophus]